VLLWDGNWFQAFSKAPYITIISSWFLPHLHSSATDAHIKAVLMPGLASLFALPLSEEACAEFLTFQDTLQAVALQTEDDSWSFFGPASKFHVSKAYKLLMGNSIIHEAFHWMWRSCCQDKHRVSYFHVLLSRVRQRHT
jgi:hypothetical protein